MIFVRDKGQMCNNILQYAHVYAWARENRRHCMSMRFAYKYPFFKISNTKNHNFLMYMVGKYGAKMKALPVVNYELEDKEKEKKEKFILCHKNVVIEGWGVRYYDLFLKYKAEILQLFDFKEEIHRKVDKLLASSSEEETLRIGVHIRRGDYQTFFNGMYYFYDHAFLYYIKEVMRLNPNRKYTVYICGNDPSLNKDYYTSNLPGVTVCFPAGNAGEDLCLLSKCDYLVGPPSSYSLVATMYGKARLHWMTCDRKVLEKDDFQDFDTLFRTFDNYWANPPVERKKVLFLISRFLDGGIDTVLVEYINNLCNLTNHQISLGIMLKMNELEVFTGRLPDNINLVHLVPAKWLSWYKRKGRYEKHALIGVMDEIFLNPIRRLVTQIALWKMMKKHDVVIDFDSTFGAFMPKSNKKRKISFFHFSFAAEYQRDKRHMMRRLNNMRKYDYIVTLSDAMLKEALEVCPELETKLVRIYNSVDMHRVLVQARDEVRNPLFHRNYMLAVERLEESQKDIATLIRAYAELKRRDIRNLPLLYVIGEGKSRQQLEEMIRQLQLEDEVLLLGFMQNPFPWMANAQLIVHSAKFEGLPTVLIESLMLEKLIISSDCPTGPREILKNGKAGVLVPVGNHLLFADAIQCLLSDIKLQSAIIKEVRKHKKVFLADRSISALEQLF